MGACASKVVVREENESWNSGTRDPLYKSGKRINFFSVSRNSLREDSPEKKFNSHKIDSNFAMSKHHNEIMKGFNERILHRNLEHDPSGSLFTRRQVGETFDADDENLTKLSNFLERCSPEGHFVGAFRLHETDNMVFDLPIPKGVDRKAQEDCLSKKLHLSVFLTANDPLFATYLSKKKEKGKKRIELVQLLEYLDRWSTIQLALFPNSKKLLHSFCCWLYTKNAILPPMKNSDYLLNNQLPFAIHILCQNNSSAFGDIDASQRHFFLKYLLILLSYLKPFNTKNDVVDYFGQKRRLRLALYMSDMQSFENNETSITVLPSYGQYDCSVDTGELFCIPTDQGGLDGPCQVVESCRGQLAFTSNQHLVVLNELQPICQGLIWKKIIQGGNGWRIPTPSCVAKVWLSVIQVNQQRSDEHISDMLKATESWVCGFTSLSDNSTSHPDIDELGSDSNLLSTLLMNICPDVVTSDPSESINILREILRVALKLSIRTMKQDEICGIILPLLKMRLDNIKQNFQKANCLILLRLESWCHIQSITDNTEIGGIVLLDKVGYPKFVNSNSSRTNLELKLKDRLQKVSFQPNKNEVPAILEKAVRGLSPGSTCRLWISSRTASDPLWRARGIHFDPSLIMAKGCLFSVVVSSEKVHENLPTYTCGTNSSNLKEPSLLALVDQMGKSAAQSCHGVANYIQVANRLEKLSIEFNQFVTENIRNHMFSDLGHSTSNSRDFAWTSLDNLLIEKPSLDLSDCKVIELINDSKLKDSAMFSSQASDTCIALRKNCKAFYIDQGVMFFIDVKMDLGRMRSQLKVTDNLFWNHSLEGNPCPSIFIVCVLGRISIAIADDISCRSIIPNCEKVRTNLKLIKSQSNSAETLLACQLLWDISFLNDQHRNSLSLLNGAGSLYGFYVAPFLDCHTVIDEFRHYEFLIVSNYKSTFIPVSIFPDIVVPEISVIRPECEFMLISLTSFEDLLDKTDSELNNVLHTKNFNSMDYCMTELPKYMLMFTIASIYTSGLPTSFLKKAEMSMAMCPDEGASTSWSSESIKTQYIFWDGESNGSEKEVTDYSKVLANTIIKSKYNSFQKDHLQLINVLLWTREHQWKEIIMELPINVATYLLTIDTLGKGSMDILAVLESFLKCHISELHSLVPIHHLSQLGHVFFNAKSLERHDQNKINCFIINNIPISLWSFTSETTEESGVIMISLLATFNFSNLDNVNDFVMMSSCEPSKASTIHFGNCCPDITISAAIQSVRHLFSYGNMQINSNFSYASKIDQSSLYINIKRLEVLFQRFQIAKGEGLWVLFDSMKSPSEICLSQGDRVLLSVVCLELIGTSLIETLELLSRMESPISLEAVFLTIKAIATSTKETQLQSILLLCLAMSYIKYRKLSTVPAESQFNDSIQTAKDILSEIINITFVSKMDFLCQCVGICFQSPSIESLMATNLTPNSAKSAPIIPLIKFKIDTNTINLQDYYFEKKVRWRYISMRRRHRKQSNDSLLPVRKDTKIEERYILILDKIGHKEGDHIRSLFHHCTDGEEYKKIGEQIFPSAPGLLQIELGKVLLKLHLSNNSYSPSNDISPFCFVNFSILSALRVSRSLLKIVLFSLLCFNPWIGYGLIRDPALPLPDLTLSDQNCDSIKMNCLLELISWVPQALSTTREILLLVSEAGARVSVEYIVVLLLCEGLTRLITAGDVQAFSAFNRQALTAALQSENHENQWLKAMDVYRKKHFESGPIIGTEEVSWASQTSISISEISQKVNPLVMYLTYCLSMDEYLKNGDISLIEEYNFVFRLAKQSHLVCPFAIGPPNALPYELSFRSNIHPPLGSRLQSQGNLEKDNLRYYGASTAESDRLSSSSELQKSRLIYLIDHPEDVELIHQRERAALSKKSGWETAEILLWNLTEMGFSLVDWFFSLSFFEDDDNRHKPSEIPRCLLQEIMTADGAQVGHNDCGDQMESRVFAFGANHFAGCLGIGRPKYYRHDSNLYDLFPEYKHQNVQLMKSGTDVWWSGSAITVPRFDGLSVVQVVCGEQHSVALTSDGRLYSWGSNKHGQCGVPVVESEDVRYKCPKNFADLSIEGCHCPLISERRKKALQEKENLSITKLLIESRNPQSYIECISYKAAQNVNSNLKKNKIPETEEYYDSDYLLPTAIPTPRQIVSFWKPREAITEENLDNEPIFFEISVGAKFSAARTKEGVLYLWGSTADGCLGNASLFAKSKTMPFENRPFQLHGEAVADDLLAEMSNISLKYKHLSWAKKCELKGHLIAYHINRLHHLKHISCGTMHIAAIDRYTGLWIWGLGEAGQLGVADKALQLLSKSSCNVGKSLEAQDNNVSSGVLSFPHRLRLFCLPLNRNYLIFRNQASCMDEFLEDSAEYLRQIIRSFCNDLGLPCTPEIIAQIAFRIDDSEGRMLISLTDNVLLEHSTYKVPFLFNSSFTHQYEVKFQLVACGESHSLALGGVAAINGGESTASNALAVSNNDLDFLFAWGQCSYGQLGVGEGKQHSIDTGVLFGPQTKSAQNATQSFPLADYRIQSEINSKNTPCLVSWKSSVPVRNEALSNFELEASSAQSEVNSHLSSKQRKVASTIQALRVGGCASLALLYDGTVLVWGANDFGVLGFAESRVREVKVPTYLSFKHVPQLANDKVKIVDAVFAAGAPRLFCQSADGAIISFGKDSYGASGCYLQRTKPLHQFFDQQKDVYENNKNSIALILPRIFSATEIVSIGAGSSHTVIVGRCLKQGRGLCNEASVLSCSQMQKESDLKFPSLKSEHIPKEWLERPLNQIQLRICSRLQQSKIISLKGEPCSFSSIRDPLLNRKGHQIMCLGSSMSSAASSHLNTDFYVDSNSVASNNMELVSFDSNAKKQSFSSSKIEATINSVFRDARGFPSTEFSFASIESEKQIPDKERNVTSQTSTGCTSLEEFSRNRRFRGHSQSFDPPLSINQSQPLTSKSNFSATSNKAVPRIHALHQREYRALSRTDSVSIEGTEFDWVNNELREGIKEGLTGLGRFIGKGVSNLNQMMSSQKSQSFVSDVNEADTSSTVQSTRFNKSWNTFIGKSPQKRSHGKLKSSHNGKARSSPGAEKQVGHSHTLSSCRIRQTDQYDFQCTMQGQTRREAFLGSTIFNPRISVAHSKDMTRPMNYQFEAYTNEVPRKSLVAIKNEESCYNDTPLSLHTSDLRPVSCSPVQSQYPYSRQANLINAPDCLCGYLPSSDSSHLSNHHTIQETLKYPMCCRSVSSSQIETEWSHPPLSQFKIHGQHEKSHSNIYNTPEAFIHPTSLYSQYHSVNPLMSNETQLWNHMNMTIPPPNIISLSKSKKSIRLPPPPSPNLMHL